MRERGINAAQAMKELGGGNNDSGSHGKIVKAYDYIGADGKLKYQICRKDPKADFPGAPAGWQRRLDLESWGLTQLTQSNLAFLSVTFRGYL